jgi:energy-converting hydrogenase Eha subunit A
MRICSLLPSDPQGYIAGGAADSRIYLGTLLELILIIANIGTAVVLIPILKRQHEILTFSYVVARIMECVFIAVGILAVLAVVTLRHDAGADAASLGGLAESLAAIKDWTFKLGPDFVVASGTGWSWAT